MLGIGMGLSRSTTSSGWDPDALDYINRVEIADGQELAANVKLAVNRFIIDCKRSASPVAGVSNWEAIKASCLLAGPRTLAGALTPLKGPAPTNFNFVSGDYNPSSGLKGNGSTKNLNTHYRDDVQPNNNRHLAVYTTERTAASGHTALIGSGMATPGVSQLFCYNGVQLEFRLCALSDATTSYLSEKFIAGNRAPGAPNQINWRLDDLSGAASSIPNAPFGGDIFVFSRGGSAYSNARMSFYSIGDSVDLFSFHAAITNYMEVIS